MTDSTMGRTTKFKPEYAVQESVIASRKGVGKTLCRKEGVRYGSA